MPDPNLALNLLEWFSFFYMMALVLAFLSLFAVSSVMILRFQKKARAQALAPDNPIQMPPVSIMIPAYNEAAVIVDSLELLFNLDYPEFEIVVVNDGSQDATMQVLMDTYRLQPISTVHPAWVTSTRILAAYRSPLRPNLVVVDKAHARKADALNAAINFSQYPLYCCMDADSTIRSDGLLRCVQPFLNDPSVVGVGAGLRVMEGATLHREASQPSGAQTFENPAREIQSIEGGVTLTGGKGKRHFQPRTWFKNLIVGFQILEYLQAFQMARMAWTAVNASPLLSGAFVLYKKQVVIQAGGYRSGCIGDDSDMTLRVHQYLTLINPRPYKLAYVPEPICWTQVPTDLKSLFHQRARWQRGLADGILYRPKLFLTPQHWGLGFVALPFSIMFEMLSPLLEVFGLVILGTGAILGYIDAHNYGVALLFIVSYWYLLSAWSLVMDQLTYQTYKNPGDVTKLMLLALLKPFGYNQFTLLARVYGMLQQMTGRKRRHGPMERHPLAMPSAPMDATSSHRNAQVASA